MSSSEPTRQDWSRHVVKTVDAPDWPSLSAAQSTWLCLEGAYSETLETEVQGIAQHLHHQWVWRGTALEYPPPGYRHGPLLVPLNEPLLDHFITTWAPAQAGLLVMSQEHSQYLVGHLQQLHSLLASDGLPLSFNLTAFRQLEELCEALSPERLAELLGPVRRLMWCTGHPQASQWLCVDAPETQAPALTPGQSLRLTPLEEEALDRASHRGFMRNSARLFAQRHPDLARPEHCNEFHRQLTIFATEAQTFGLSLEQDVQHYLSLRLNYPQSAFENDPVLRETLTRLEVTGLQRMQALENRLRQTVPPAE